MKTGQTVYVVIGTDVQATTVKEFDGKLLDIEPIYLQAWGDTISVLEAGTLPSGAPAPWGAYEKRGDACHHFARVYTDLIDAMEIVEKVALVYEINHLVSVNRSVSTLRKIKEVLGND
jgi:hypothetical protein